MRSSIVAAGLLASVAMAAVGAGGAAAQTSAAAATAAPGTLQTSGFDAQDAVFGAVYIDIDELRGGEIPRRYVHGGFTGTDTRFAFHFPAAAQYQGRFFQYLTPVPDSETLSQGLTGEQDRIGAALTGGAIFVETNGGGAKAAEMSIGRDQTIGAYRANAASARFARHLAQQIYGAHRTYGYAYGGSGGAYRTIGSLENTKGVWDGAVPFVMGSPMAIPSMFTVRLQTMRILGDKLDGVVDALDAGGSGDPYAGLTAHEADALREVSRMGFPLPAWYSWRTMGPHAFALLFGGIRMIDAAYFTDFWAKPGYLGHDRPELLASDREQLTTTVAAVITADEAQALGIETGRQAGQSRGTADLAWKALGLQSAGQMPVAFRLAAAPKSKALMLADLVLADGRKINLRDVAGDVAVAGINTAELLAAVKSGDTVRIDNSDILAVQSYHRHQVPPGREYPVWDQFRKADGTPLYPQRPLLLGPMLTKNAAGSVPTGKFDGKMILIENLWDREALPWQGDWYRARIREQHGAAADSNFRIWFTDRALHGERTQQEDMSRAVSYGGVLQQALRDLAQWVEKGVTPAPSTAYQVVDGQVIVPMSAAQRRGIQPVVGVTANRTTRANVRAGEPVRLAGTITAPPGTGAIVSAKWDFDGDGKIDADAVIPAGKRQKITVRAAHSYAVPGTYFAVLHGVSQRSGDRATSFARIQNLARVRVVVR